MCDVQTILQSARAFRPVRDVANEVARAAGMASSTMTARMQGKQPFDAWQMEAIAEALKIPPEEYNKYFFDRRKGA